MPVCVQPSSRCFWLSVPPWCRRRRSLCRCHRRGSARSCSTGARVNTQPPFGVRSASVPCPTTRRRRSCAVEMNPVKAQATQRVRSLCPSSGSEPLGRSPRDGMDTSPLIRVLQTPSAPAVSQLPPRFAPELPRAPFRLLCSGRGCSRSTGGRGCSVRAAGARLGVAWGALGLQVWGALGSVRLRGCRLDATRALWRCAGAALGFVGAGLGSAGAASPPWSRCPSPPAAPSPRPERGRCRPVPVTAGAGRKRGGGGAAPLPSRCCRSRPGPSPALPCASSSRRSRPT